MLYTIGMEHSPTHPRDRHRLGADAVARDAAGGWEVATSLRYSELSYKDEATSAYDRAFAHVSTHFLPFLLRAGRPEKATRTRGCHSRASAGLSLTSQ